MGVPKFFRWLSERYPKINQRYGSLPDPETAKEHFPERSSPPEPFEAPDPMATCGLAPPIDRLYLDMNGIIHGCSHNNNDDEDNNQDEKDTDAFVEAGSRKNQGISREEIFRNVCYYLDRVIGDMIQPGELVYMAIDGVAPRAKMNQQRSRRYRSGGEGEIETTIYEAHRAKQEEQDRLLRIEEDGFADDDDEDGIQEELYDSSYSFVLDHNEGNQIPSAYHNREDEENIMNKTKKPSGSKLEEVSHGRFKGKFEASSSSSSSSSSVHVANGARPEANYGFHSNEITPGTPFFAEFTKHLEHFVKFKLSTDPKWKHLTIIFSGPNVPGEGEHKIMQFLREQREQPDYNPNLKHCIMGQDGDLIMLGLLTHEPNMVLFREKVVFNMSSARLEKAHAAEAASKDKKNSSSSLSSSLDTYIYNPHFEFLHMQVLRDYLAYEFETSNVLNSSPWDLERTIDDFVFLTFLIGNDFLPHLPALDIADQAFDLLYYTYKKCRKEWLEEWEERGGDAPYLTNAGNIVSGQRLEGFLTAVGSHEVTYYEKKKQTADAENRRLRKQYKRLNMKDTLPDDSLVASKEEADRAAYRRMLKEMEYDTPAVIGTGDEASNRNEDERETRNNECDNDGSMSNSNFVPVTTKKVEFQPVEDDLEEGLISRMGSLLQNSLSHSNNDADSDDLMKYELADVDDQDLKGRYYYDKFEFTPFDADKHHALRKAYMEGLVWNLKYYYEGCVSWDWYYPYHYGPMLSDLVNLDEILNEISFEDNAGAPLTPFHQLMGCMPPSQAHHLPEPYRWLMTDENSPIVDFYPNSFVVDMNGKRWPWEAVTLLPFIDSQRLIEATSSIDMSKLSPAELDRNATGNTVVLTHDPDHLESVPSIGKTKMFQGIDTCTAVTVPFEETGWNYTQDRTAIFKPEIKAGTKFPLPGFATLRDAPVETLYRRRLGINVHGGKSRYKTASLEISSMMPPLPPVKTLAPKLIGTTVFVNYPYFVEALVTAVSDEHMTVRGNKEPREWTTEEANKWKLQRDGIIRRAEVGEGYCGTGGVIVPEDQAVTLSVRPFQGFVTTKSGLKAKSFATFELEIPLVSTFWAPSQPDPRLIGVPSRLEKNAYEIAMSNPGIDPFMTKTSKKIGKRGGTTKRRKLFPEKSKKVPSMKVGLGKTKISAASYSSSLPRFRDGNMHRRDFSSFASPSSIVNALGSFHLDTTPFSSVMTASILRDSRVVRPTVESKIFSRITSSSATNMNAPFKRQESSKYSTPRKVNPALYAKYTAGGFRGRAVAAGLAIAALYMNPTNAANEMTSHPKPFWKPSLQRLSNQSDFPGVIHHPWLLLRGGDYEDSSHAPFSGGQSTPPLEFAHGTTTLSFAFQGGIIAAVDSRASMGQFVGSKTTQKVLPVSSHILGTMAGGAADCQHWIRKLKSEALLHQLTEDGRRMSVARASRILADYLYALRGYDLSVGTMIMGYDDNEDSFGSEDYNTDCVTSDGGSGNSGFASLPHIYYVDNTGLRIQGDMFAVGSGSTFALGILDSEPNRHNLSVDEAISLGIKAIRHATFRDAYSGGYINVYLITPKDGWKKVYTEDIARKPEIWESLQDEPSFDAPTN